ncbi:unnamed protein product [Calicophoron daubneyi]|uniref:Uncharacterized protein n=1 Tax=Calicophoron daubneyi TaxID=300641 RepID=A0AAV2TRQ9_CALDB
MSYDYRRICGKSTGADRSESKHFISKHFRKVGNDQRSVTAESEREYLENEDSVCQPSYDRPEHKRSKHYARSEDRSSTEGADATEREAVLRDIVRLLNTNTDLYRPLHSASTANRSEKPKMSEPRHTKNVAPKKISSDTLERLHRLLNEAYEQAENEEQLTKLLESLLPTSKNKDSTGDNPHKSGVHNEFDCRPFQGPKTPPTPNSRHRNSTIHQGLQKFTAVSSSNYHKEHVTVSSFSEYDISHAHKRHLLDTPAEPSLQHVPTSPHEPLKLREPSMRIESPTMAQNDHRNVLKTSGRIYCDEHPEDPRLRPREHSEKRIISNKRTPDSFKSSHRTFNLTSDSEESGLISDPHYASKRTCDHTVYQYSSRRYNPEFCCETERTYEQHENLIDRSEEIEHFYEKFPDSAVRRNFDRPRMLDAQHRVHRRLYDQELHCHHQAVRSCPHSSATSFDNRPRRRTSREPALAPHSAYDGSFEKHEKLLTCQRTCNYSAPHSPSRKIYSKNGSLTGLHGQTKRPAVQCPSNNGYTGKYRYFNRGSFHPRNLPPRSVRPNHYFGPPSPYAVACSYKFSNFMSDSPESPIPTRKNDSLIQTIMNSERNQVIQTCPNIESAELSHRDYQNESSTNEANNLADLQKWASNRRNHLRSVVGGLPGPQEENFSSLKNEILRTPSKSEDRMQLMEKISEPVEVERRTENGEEMQRKHSRSRTQSSSHSSSVSSTNSSSSETSDSGDTSSSCGSSCGSCSETPQSKEHSDVNDPEAVVRRSISDDFIPPPVSPTCTSDPSDPGLHAHQASQNTHPQGTPTAPTEEVKMRLRTSQLTPFTEPLIKSSTVEEVKNDKGPGSKSSSPVSSKSYIQPNPTKPLEIKKDDKSLQGETISATCFRSDSLVKPKSNITVRNSLGPTEFREKADEPSTTIHASTQQTSEVKKNGGRKGDRKQRKEKPVANDQKGVDLAQITPNKPLSKSDAHASGEEEGEISSDCTSEVEELQLTKHGNREERLTGENYGSPVPGPRPAKIRINEYAVPGSDFSRVVHKSSHDSPSERHSDPGFRFPLGTRPPKRRRLGDDVHIDIHHRKERTRILGNTRKFAQNRALYAQEREAAEREADRSHLSDSKTKWDSFRSLGESRKFRLRGRYSASNYASSFRGRTNRYGSDFGHYNHRFGLRTRSSFRNYPMSSFRTAERFRSSAISYRKNTDHRRIFDIRDEKLNRLR